MRAGQRPWWAPYPDGVAAARPATAGWKESGWKDYRFGTPAAISDANVPVADFLTDLQGTAPLHVTLPARPQEPGLYQAILTSVADADSGVPTRRR